MSWILQQGLSPSAASATHCLFRWGAPPTHNQGSGLICSPGEGGKLAPRLWRQQVGRLTLEQEFSRGDNWLTYAWTEGTYIHFYWQQWGEDLPRPKISGAKRELWIPLQAWVEDRWYDGSVRAEFGGLLQAWVGAGVEGQLWLADPPVAASAVDEDIDSEKLRGRLEKESLKLALQKRLGSLTESALSYPLERWDAQDVMLLMGLRIAYPHTWIYPSTAVGLSPPWRRLMQNLCIETRPPGRLDLVRPLKRAELWPEADTLHFAAALRRLQLSAPFLPAQLLKELCEEV